MNTDLKNDTQAEPVALLREIRGWMDELRENPRKGDMVFRCGFNGALDVIRSRLDARLAAAPQPQASADADDLALMDEALSAAGYAKRGIYGEAWQRIEADMRRLLGVGRG